MRFKARSKHGNYNAWIDAHGDDYEFFVSVDPDHVPLANFCERLLGYFRDPDVAFVVGPQVYGNYDNFVTKGAESQQFVFHSLIQRLGNFFGCPMLVGTNNAVRISALREIGGLRDSITEDLATSLRFTHRAIRQRAATGDRSTRPTCWRWVRDPASFTDFFSQQQPLEPRYVRELPRPLVGQHADTRLGRRGCTTALITSYYPTAAIGWVLGGVELRDLPGGRGQGRDRQPRRCGLAVYVDLACVQFVLYASNRHYNVSPHEAPGSSGAVGMCMSVMAAPIYVTHSASKRARPLQRGFVRDP